MSDFTPNKLGFDYAGCTKAMILAADALMSQMSDVMVTQFKWQIDRNGNGSQFMKDDAKRVVHEILHDVAVDHINIKAGFDENMARAMATDFYVRVMVVIYGNQGQGPIEEKPGRPTWKKNVLNYGIPDPDKRTGRKLPQFDQFDVSVNIRDNVMQNMEMWFQVVLIRLAAMFDGAFFGQFITVT